MRRHGRFRTFVYLLLLGSVACRPDVSPTDAAWASSGSSPTVETPTEPALEELAEPALSGRSADEERVAEESNGRADRDPFNDDEVAPPAAILDCHERLQAAGVDFIPAEIPLRRGTGGVAVCGAHDAVVYRAGPTGLSIRPPALVSCHLALSLLDLEHLMQELAQKYLNVKVRSIHQGGTYNCRKMARFDWVSEHSYGNAIDVRSFTLMDGRSVSVLKHFGKLGEPPSDERAQFLREFGEQAFDRDLVSVSLGPYWDALHRDHFHFDMARYRVDGSRP